MVSASLRVRPAGRWARGNAKGKLDAMFFCFFLSFLSLLYRLWSQVVMLSFLYFTCGERLKGGVRLSARPG